MAEPLRHRQTKEADNRYVRPTATAPHLDSTMTDKTQSEHNASAYPPIADIGADIVFRRFGAMCGRLRVGKENLHVAGLVGAAMCSAC
jgi:hypothetical protein